MPVAMLLVAALGAGAVHAQSGPSASLGFVPASIASGGTSTLTITYNAGSGAQAAINVNSGALASPLSVVAASGATTCPGGIFTYGANSFAYAATIADVLPSNGACTIAVNVTGVVATATTVTQPSLAVVATAIPCGGTCSTSSTNTGPATLNISAPLAITTPSPLPTGTLGTPYSATFAATGGSGGYTWTITSGTVPAGLGLSAGGVLAGTPTAFGTFNFTVQVSDKLGATSSKAFALTVNPAALVVTTASPLPGGVVGAVYSTSLAASGGVLPYAWSVAAGTVPPGLALSSSGTLAGTPTAFGTFTFTAQVTDNAATTASKVLSVTVAPAPLVITTIALPGGVQGAPYAASLAASGGAVPYAWSVAAGTLPPGVTLSTGGALSGIPTSVGTFTFTAQVTDALAATGTRSFTVAVGPPALAIVTGTPLAPPLGFGVPFAVSFAASGGVPPYAWSVAGGALPPGLVLSPAGVLTGTPGALGTFTFTVRVLDAANTSATRSYTLDVVVPPLAIVTPAPLAPPIDVAGPFRATLVADGGLPPYRWSLSNGALPPGLALGVDGVVSGTPTKAGTFTFDARVADAAGNATSRTYTLVVLSVSAPMSVAIAPSPAVMGQPVVVTATLGGAVVPTGVVDVFVAGGGQRCPDPFVAGAPGAEIPVARSATIDTTGRARIDVTGLRIDDYAVCVRYGGDGLYSGALAGPFALAVIKGVVIAPRDPAQPGLTLVLEYYHPALDHYFITDDVAEIGRLDAGTLVGWRRTGYAFWAFDRAFPAPAAEPVCRYYLPPGAGDSHFLSASPVECAAVESAVAQDPHYAGVVRETSRAFAIRLPDVTTGVCAPGLQPVYRVWNARGDSNHRYTTDAGARDALVSRGYVAEGYGPDAVAMCAP